MAIPKQLIAIDRWLTWRNIEGKKIPSIPLNDASKWQTFDNTHSALSGKDGGIGFILDVSDDIGGIDLDGCRDPQTGVLTDWALSIVKGFGSYTEVSPSGTGVKIFAAGCPPKISPNVLAMPGEPIQGKSPAIEIYTSGRYFAVTGIRYAETSEEVVSNPAAWLRLISLVKNRTEEQEKTETRKKKRPDQNGRNNKLASLAGTMRRKGFELEAILAALHLENEAKFDPPLPDKEVEIIAKSVCRYEPSADDFARNQNNKVLENNQDNIRLALFKMKILVRYNEFTTPASPPIRWASRGGVG